MGHYRTSGKFWPVRMIVPVGESIPTIHFGMNSPSGIFKKADRLYYDPDMFRMTPEGQDFYATMQKIMGPSQRA
ncbi:hypothetical protein G3A39_42470 [Paraburkholderia aspalathi]|nr:hypothetical protein [Paraburkholderia aspalathi]